MIIIEENKDRSILVCKNATSIIIGLLPFDWEIDVVSFEFENKYNYDEILDYSLVKTIKYFTYYIRTNGLLIVGSYYVKMKSINATIVSCPEIG